MGFLCGVSRLFWRETPRAEQTNDFYSPASRAHDDYFQIKSLDIANYYIQINTYFGGLHFSKDDKLVKPDGTK